ncbi:DeoR/GlpR family DNA-binding transcription regulator [Enterococcus ratti]|uniref:DeoR/GlpR family DNA-binding transcription regulator n=1 Tax=Enterococcus ratti TaxID=150033 RepID=UPI002481B227|nr:DeoR/GlpR family DNA-binding transcription regulator [Enterococcus ratti]
MVNHLKINQFAKMVELIDLVNYSESTIKRDLIALEKSGLIRRVRGGAMLVDNQKIDVPYIMKITHLDEETEKHYIAGVASTLIKDDMVLFLDSSTTSLHLVCCLGKFEGLQVITNGVITAAMLSEFTTAKVSIVGGTIVQKRATINGAKAYNDILTYAADLAIISCRGFDFNQGVTETHEGEALVKRAFRKQTNRLMVLATQEKLEKHFIYQAIANHEIDYLVTSKKLSNEQLKKVRKHSIRCFY